ncbi:MAG: hypothetical protein HW373_222 [Deltaproteobacteria bacterium]|nr:hypothetical protein [Deltaproteobacteria bacterium]
MTVASSIVCIGERANTVGFPLTKMRQGGGDYRCAASSAELT